MGWRVRIPGRTVHLGRCFIVGFLLMALDASGHPIVGDLAGSGSRLQVTLVGDFGASRDFDRLLATRLAGDGVVDVIRQSSWAPSEETPQRWFREPHLRVWVVLVDASHLSVYFPDPGAGQLAVREIHLDHGLDEMTREQVALIVEQWASSAASARPRPPPPPPFTPPAPLLAPPAPPWQSTCLLGLGASYAISDRGPEGVFHGPGMLLGVACKVAETHLYFYLKGQHQMQVEPGRARSITLRAAASSLGATWAVEWPASAWFAWGAELGGGMDRMTLSAITPALSDRELFKAEVRPWGLLALRARSHWTDWSVAVSSGVVAVFSTGAGLHYWEHGPASDDFFPAFTPLPLYGFGAIELSWR